MDPNEKVLRRLLWLRHGCTGLYGDDGEMQCGACLIDFRRDAVEDIERRFTEIGLAKLHGIQPMITKQGNFVRVTGLEPIFPEVTTVKVLPQGPCQCASCSGYNGWFASCLGYKP